MTETPVSSNGHKSFAEQGEIAKDRTPNTFRQIGQSGLNRASGMVFEEFLPVLSGTNAIRVYKEMESNDPIVGSMLFAINMFMRKAQWRVQAAGEEDEDKQNAQFLEECMSDMSHTWEELISDINSMLTFGWSWFEVVYKPRRRKIDKWGRSTSQYDDGKIGWGKIEIRSQDSWEQWDFEEDTGDVQGMWQRPPPHYNRLYIPAGKSLLFRTTARKGSPEGKSVLRNAYRSYYFKKRMEEIEGIGVERDLAGLPFAEVPAEMMRDDASAADKQALQGIVNLVKSVRRDESEGIVWPQSWDDQGNKLYEFTLMNSGGTRQFDTSSIVQRYETRIAMTVLADFILLGNNDTHGSFALSTSKTGMFQAALGSWMDDIAAVFNNQAIPRLMRLNGIAPPYPTIVPEDVQKPSIADLSTFVSALAGAGANLFPDPELENHLRDFAKLPLLDEDEYKDEAENIREQNLDTQLAVEQVKEKLAHQGILPGSGSGQQPGSEQQPGQQGGQGRKRPGSPSKSTGKVKSKLPPQERRRTKATNAGENTGG